MKDLLKQLENLTYSFNSRNKMLSIMVEYQAEQDRVNSIRLSEMDKLLTKNKELMSDMEDIKSLIHPLLNNASHILTVATVVRN
jgi:hypothetical protein